MPRTKTVANPRRARPSPATIVRMVPNIVVPPPYNVSLNNGYPRLTM
jgi:hypothetical protein